MIPEQPSDNLFTIDEIYEAYRRWKHFIYHDKSYLLYRKRCAEFECGEEGSNEGDQDVNDQILEYKLNRLLECLNQTQPDFSEWIEKVISFPIPKTLKKNTDSPSLSENEKKQPKCLEKKRSSTIIHNTQSDDIIYERVTWLIDAPVEIHIVSTLWVIKHGRNLQDKYKKCNYGNKLIENLKQNGLSLFKPYHFNYQKWRDSAIKEAQQLVDKKEDVLIIGLDVKDYYHSIRIGKNEYLSPDQAENDQKINKLGVILFRVASHYFRNPPFGQNKLVSKRGLPIGLVSSAILANWYLKEFDALVLDELQPSFYGRYVDDILIVLKMPKKCKNIDEIKFRSDKYLDLILDPHDVNCERALKAVKNLKIQNEKVVLYYFDADEPSTMLDKFIQEIKERSSEFRFLPTEEDEKMDFHEAAFSIHYDDSIMKLRSIKDFTPDRFGVSSYLAKMIYGAITVSKTAKPKIAHQIHSFFKGGRAIEFYTLWEKAATYFVVTKDKNGLSKFEKSINNSISRIEKSDKSLFEIEELRKTLKIYWQIAKAMALALHPELTDTIDDLSYKLRKSNLIRHDYVAYPMVNYLQFKNENWSYLDFKWEDILEMNYEEVENMFRKSSWKFSPRFVHFHEIALIWIERHLLNLSTGEDEPVPLDKYVDSVFKIYYQFNYIRRQMENGAIDKTLDELRNKFFEIQKEPIAFGSELNIHAINISTKASLDIPKIAIANMEIKPEDIKQSYLQKPNLSPKRRDVFYGIINQVIEHGGADFLILPEACVPYRWVSLLCKKVKGQNMTMVFGLEHWVKNQFAYNFIVTLLPVKVKAEMSEEGGDQNGFDGVIPIFRLKNHYSPAEIENLTGYRHKIPKIRPAVYHLFNWRGLKFTAFNCFELSDIIHRAVFRSKIDILIACEYNQDVNYFSNLAESTSRDLHCFFIQANNSKFGDSRITQPVKTDSKDLLRIKGGDNSTILIESINVDLLRKFQFKEWNLQLNDKSFKPTPPGFDNDEVGKRLNLKSSKQNKKNAI